MGRFQKPKIDTMEWRLAERIQRSMIPKPVMRKDIEIDVRYHPMALLGGDYASIHWASKKRLYLTLCDVSGHGIAAAILANRVSSEVHHLLKDAPEPWEVVEGLNRFICEHFHLSVTKLFLTFSCTLIDLDTQKLWHAGAGHLPGLLVPADGSQSKWLKSNNVLIGYYEDCMGKNPQFKTNFDKDDVIVLYTDGITETFNDRRELFSEQGIEKAVFPVRSLPAADMADAVLREVELWRAGPVLDDILLMIAKVK